MRISDIVSYLKEYILFGIVLVVLFFIGYIVIYKKIMKGKKSIKKDKLILYGISIFYIGILLGAVFLNRNALYGAANLHIFSSYREAYNKMELSLVRNIILNILLFVPFGFLLPIYTDKLKKLYKVVLLGFLVTLIIETIQYIARIGIFEIDDIFNNTIGVLIGYCVFMIYKCLRDKKNIKYIAFYIMPIFITIFGFLGMYLKYQGQELGNLSIEYNYRLNMKNVNIQNEIILSDKRENQDVFYKKILTQDETRKLAENIFAQIETNISQNDTIIYENTAIYYADDRKYSLWIDYKGGTYSYTDFSQFSHDEGNERTKKIGVSREEIEIALQKLGIQIPKKAEFKEDENGNYVFLVKMQLQEDKLINGNITCSYYTDGKIKKLENNLVEYEKVKSMEIISKQEAYNRILDGKFQYDEYYIGKIKDMIIENVSLGYSLDSKGYYVPIYVFNCKLNNRDTKIEIKAING